MCSAAGTCAQPTTLPTFTVTSGRMREVHPLAEAAVQIETNNMSRYACYLHAPAGATLQ
jgi:hypothetical protein